MAAAELECRLPPYPAIRPLLKTIRRPRMEKRRLGRTDLLVTQICLGTMTWGQQNTEAEGYAQMDLAFDRGVNFLDTAEMYPIPPRSHSLAVRPITFVASTTRSRLPRAFIQLPT